MSTDPVINLNKVSVKFKLKDRKVKDFYALKDFSVKVNKGEVLGIIGKNGAGKSTLLKTIAGIYVPESGAVKVDGRIAPLIELGASFIPDLSGIDNIFFTGGIFGYTKKEIEEKVSKIVEFSDLQEFINQPVKTYSTGMFARLSFATMLFFEPDVVLIDEVFAVGDEDFQKKSMNKIFEFREKGKTVLIASHNIELIERFSTKVLVLDKGEKIFEGDPEPASSFYLSNTDSGRSEEIKNKNELERWGNKKIEITDYFLLNKEGKQSRIFDKDDYLEIKINYKVNTKQDFYFGIALKSDNGFLVCGPNIKVNVNEISEEGNLKYIIPRLPINEGKFNIDLALYDTELVESFEHISNALSFTIPKNSLRDLGYMDLSGEWKINS